MKRETALTHEFVEYIPKELEPGRLYVCMPFATVVHKCCCGCGHEVVTPLSPTDWTLLFDGESISLDPSIGNWSFNCQSHYWIRRNKVQWAPRWSRRQIDAGRAGDGLAKDRYFDPPPTSGAGQAGKGRPARTLWARLKNWWGWSAVIRVAADENRGTALTGKRCSYSLPSSFKTEGGK